MSARNRDEYRRTLFDRHGAEAAQLAQTVRSLSVPIIAGAATPARCFQPRHLYASNLLVDLYLAWPGHETKGLRELRRLIDTYPETDVAARARAGLVNLKGQLGISE
jgi:hypothetical protein